MFHETREFDSYRPPYLPTFFAECARRIGLSRQTRLLDIGCGWGDVLFGFAPYVGSLTGLEPELPSLEALQAHARDTGVSVRTVNAPVERADPGLGPFDLITIGRAFWYMEKARTLELIDGWLAPGGRLMVCAPREQPPDGEPWERTLYLIIGRWMISETDPRRITEQEFFGGHFAQVDSIDVYGEQSIDLEHLVKRAYGQPVTSPAALGDAAEDMARDIRRVMGRFFKNGPIREKLHTGGLVYARRSEVPAG
jgi:SAM-dependent methyltransferase